MATLDDVIAVFKCTAKEDLVAKLVEDGSVETLTGMKIALLERCQVIEGFPRGEHYARRRPKNASAFANLEQRLADDIAELLNCLDSKVVTPEVRNMFKQPVISIDDDNNKSTEKIATPNKSYSSPTKYQRSSGWSGMKNQVSSLESGFLLFKEKVLADIKQLQDEIKVLSAEVNNQNIEITSLKEENQHLRQICINCNKTEAHSSVIESIQSSDEQVNSAENNACLVDNTLHIFQVDNCHDRITTPRGNRVHTQINGSENLTTISSAKADSLLMSENIKNNKNKVDSQKDGEKDSPSQTTQQETGKNNKEQGYSEAVKRAVTNPRSNRQFSRSSNQTSEQISHSDSPVEISENTQSSESTGTASNDFSGFKGVERKRDRIRRFFLSGISDNSTETQILAYLEKRGVQPTLLKLFPSKRKGTLSAKLNIQSKDCNLIKAAEFWPKYVRCRPWISSSKFEKERKERPTMEHQADKK